MRADPAERGVRRTAIIRSKQPPVVARADRQSRSGGDGESAAGVQARRPVTAGSAGLALQRAAGNAAAAQFMARRGHGRGSRPSTAAIQREVKQLGTSGKWYSTLDDYPPTIFDTRQDAEARDRELQRQRQAARPELGSQPRPTSPEGEPPPRPVRPPTRLVPVEPTSQPQLAPPGLKSQPHIVSPGLKPPQSVLPGLKPQPHIPLPGLKSQSQLPFPELKPQPQLPSLGSKPPPRFASPQSGPSPRTELTPPPPLFGVPELGPRSRRALPEPPLPPGPRQTQPSPSSVDVEEPEHVSKPPKRPQPPLPVGAQARSARQAVPRQPEPSAQGPLWRDVPGDVQQALDEAYAAHLKSPFSSHTELYENWYKQSAKKGAKQPGPEQVEAYEEQVRRHVPQIGPPVPRESYRYLDQAVQLPAVRIYVNPLPEYAAEVFANVAKLARSIPGYFGSKIGDASVAHTSRDVFVLYLDGKLASDGDALGKATVKALGDYHDRNKDKFVDEVPRFTRAVLKGVGIGAEPPGNEALSTALTEAPIGTRATTSEGELEEHHLPGSWSGEPQFSFSTYRAQLIFEALQSTRDPGSYRRRILDNFAIAGIDARAPYLQGKLPSARVLYRLGIVYRTIRLEGVPVKEPQRKGQNLGPGETLMPGERLEHEGQLWTVDTVNRLARPTEYTISRAEQVPEPDA
jgi:HopA1 effector protein family